MLKYFGGSIFFTIICLIIGGVVGYMADSSLAGAFSTFFIVLVLGILETSLSFDNAIVNVTVLKKMDAVWRRRFLTRGILIAVVGMRILFPILIVAIFGDISPREAVRLAVTDPLQYGIILSSSHIAIAGFGGAFLMMVGFKFFFDIEKDVHRLQQIETRLTKLGKIEAIEAVLVLIMLELISMFLPAAEAHQFFISGVRGVVLYIIMNGISGVLGASEESQAVQKSSAMLFLYLELLDASFSLDGVIGAFALSSNLIVIALGLGIGAYFVRSITIYLYEKGTLNKYLYLEHGAFYAIIALAAIMLMSVYIHIPEVVTGLIGAVLIGLSLYSSLSANKKLQKK